LLDLGAEPGLLALGLAPFVGEVIGVDPEPAMITAARWAADRAGVRLRLAEGRAETLPANFGVFDVVTIGRAPDWMEPEGARAALDQIVATHGQILIRRAAGATDDRNPWLPPYDATRKRCRVLH
jgi:SAM-dependent methyltransferase